MDRYRVDVFRFGLVAWVCIFDVALCVVVACLVCVVGGESIREDGRVWFVVPPWGLPGGVVSWVGVAGVGMATGGRVGARGWCGWGLAWACSMAWVMSQSTIFRPFQNILAQPPPQA